MQSWGRLPHDSIFAVTGNWTIVSGTDSYRDLHGTRTIDESFDACGGTTQGVWEGDEHFD
jgi:hypothetical protein